MVFVLLLFFVYSISNYIDLSEYGIYNGCPALNYILYNFIHIDLLHLVINCFFFILYFNKIKFISIWQKIIMLSIIPIIAGILSTYDTPTVGASSIIMCMAGMLTAHFRKQDIIRVISLFSITFCFTFFFCHINTLIHMYSFWISFLISFLYARIRNYKYK